MRRKAHSNTFKVIRELIPGWRGREYAANKVTGSIELSPLCGRQLYQEVKKNVQTNRTGK